LVKTDLSTFDNSWFKIGGSALKQILWYFANALFFNAYAFPFNSFKIGLLKVFGAKVGKGCVIKPKVNIKYPWKLSLGDYVWLGEKVWIDNLAEVKIESHACLSQGAMLLCGNHNYKKTSFDLMVGKIKIEEGAWIGAQSVVCPGVSVGSHAVLAVGSFLTHDAKAYTIYQGNPAKPIKEREIRES
jgi:putative colanic acid biosynthesis acetyltransferase WcaF